VKTKTCIEKTRKSCHNLQEFMAIKYCGNGFSDSPSPSSGGTGTEPHPAVVGQSGVAGRGAGAE